MLHYFVNIHFLITLFKANQTSLKLITVNAFAVNCQVIFGQKHVGRFEKKKSAECSSNSFCNFSAFVWHFVAFIVFSFMWRWIKMSDDYMSSSNINVFSLSLKAVNANCTTHHYFTATLLQRGIQYTGFPLFGMKKNPGVFQSNFRIFGHSSQPNIKHIWSRNSYDNCYRCRWGQKGYVTLGK